jgi:MurNAc alpha-1-phosphate uridylyltransferase
MVLAAGLGLRMRPLTDKLPKPLVEVAGQPIIDYAFGHLREAGVAGVVVNVHHLPEQLERWTRRQKGPPIVISDERDRLLDTGGGVAKALLHLGASPFFVLNGDSFWIDGELPALERMRAAWNDRKMDCLLLLAAREESIGYEGAGDFDLDARGRLLRRKEGGSSAFVYAGCFLASPRLFAGAPEGKFSMNLLWDRAIERGRLFGLRHGGLWLHVGTPQSIAVAERAIAGFAPQREARGKREFGPQPHDSR